MATNASGQTSKRRVQVYAGAYYLTELGTRFEDGGTTIALRDLAAPDVKRTIELRVFATKNGAREAQVFEAKRDGAQGPLRFFWNGKDAQGKVRDAGEYVAELRFVAPDGRVVQSVDTTFVNDTPAAQHAKYAEIEGQLQWEKGALGNTEVELLDENDNVVQRAKTTGQGNYRFRNLQGGNYKVRAKKEGFGGDDAKVTAKPAAPAASAPVMMKAQ
jgi:squalene-hopene/tetraprenyl-beta-curcumene cyclase